MNSIYKFLNQFGYEPIGTDGYVLEEIGTGYLYNAYKDYCECIGDTVASITVFQDTLRRESFKLSEGILPFAAKKWNVYVKGVDSINKFLEHIGYNSKMYLEPGYTLTYGSLCEIYKWYCQFCMSFGFATKTKDELDMYLTSISVETKHMDGIKCFKVFSAICDIDRQASTYPIREKRTISSIGREISKIDDNVCDLIDIKNSSDVDRLRIVVEDFCGDEVHRVVLSKDVLYVEGFLEDYIDQCDDRLLELKEEMKGAGLYYE